MKPDIPLLLEALPNIIKHKPNFRLLLVGGGPQEQFIKEKVKLDAFVIFTGRVPHDQVQNYYNQVDIFVYPRLTMRLTELVTPLKPLEAMAQGWLLHPMWAGIKSLLKINKMDTI